MKQNKNGYNPENDKLESITNLASALNFTHNTHDFDKDEYLSIIYIKARDLYVDKNFQRFLAHTMIKSAKRFDPLLVRPLYVFKRPDGKYSVADGQHQTVMGIIYTTLGKDVELPCQVREHDKDATLEECMVIEAEFFKALNFRRRNVTKVDKLRADIAIGDEEALKVEEKLKDMGVRIENIGCQDGPEVWGIDKIMEAHTNYGLSNVIKAIDLYTSYQTRKDAVKWNDVDKPLKGGLICGISAIFYLLNNHLGKGEKSFALEQYIEGYLWKSKPTGKDSIEHNTAGVKQGILIARRLVDSCNNLIDLDVLTKKNGEYLSQKIGEDILLTAGLGDPSKMKVTH